MQLSYSEQVETGLASIEKLAGLGWLKKWVHHLKETQPALAAMGGFLAPESIGVPPLAYLWYQAREELAMEQLGWSMGHGYAGQRVAALGKYVEALGVETLKEATEFLKAGTEFEPAIYKLQIASYFARAGMQVEFIWDGQNSTKPDIMASNTALNKKIEAICSLVQIHLEEDIPLQKFTKQELHHFVIQKRNIGINKKINQGLLRLTENYPALIYLELIPTISENDVSINSSIELGETLIKDIFKQEKLQIGGVGLTSTLYTAKQKGVEVTTYYKMVHNPNPQFNLQCIRSDAP